MENYLLSTFSVPNPGRGFEKQFCEVANSSLPAPVSILASLGRILHFFLPSIYLICTMGVVLY